MWRVLTADEFENIVENSVNAAAAFSGTMKLNYKPEDLRETFLRMFLTDVPIQGHA